jgi:hypothetical protein
MRVLAVLVVVIVILVAGAYVVGYWPVKQRNAELEQRVLALEAQVADAESKSRLAALLGRLLLIEDTVADRNFGQAQSLAAPFFDEVRAEIGRLKDPGQQQALEAVLALRDTITVSLAAADPAVATVLNGAEARVRGALGYPTPAPSPGAPTTVSPPAAGAGTSSLPSPPLATPMPSMVPTPAAVPSVPVKPTPSAAPDAR